MSLRQYWRDVKYRFKHLMFENFPAKGAEGAEKYVKAAYACCVAWYDPPLGPQKSYCVEQSIEGSSFCKLRETHRLLKLPKASAPRLTPTAPRTRGSRWEL